MEIKLVDAGDLKALSKAFKQQADGKELRRQLRGELRGLARPMVQRVKSAWLSAPSMGRPSGAKEYNPATGWATGKRGPGLRKLLAKATGSQVRFTGREVGVRVRTDGRKMPNRMKALPGYAEGVRRRGWRHPVYGNRNTWVAQQPFPRFYQAVQPDEAQARRACEDAVRAVFAKIARP